MNQGDFLSPKEFFLELIKENGSSLGRKLYDESLDHFRRLDFPSLKDEDWKYSSVSKIINEDYSTEAPGNIDSSGLNKYLNNGLKSYRLLFINGVYSEELSDEINEDGVRAGSLRHFINTAPSLRLEQDLLKYDPEWAFEAVNGCMAKDGLFLSIAKGARPSRPIHAIFYNDPGSERLLVNSRNSITLSENSSLDLVITYAGKGKYFNNIVTGINQCKGSRLNYCKIEEESNEAFHINRTESILASEAEGSVYSLSLGGSIVRNDLISRMKGKDSKASLYGLYVTNGTRHVDNHTTIDHLSPMASSHENYKGILEDSSRGVFNGRIIVRPGAEKTDSYQSNKNLLLSDGARVDTKPQLEIFADDVKCSHGATIGHLNEEEFFYIKSRGIPEEKAKAMLIRAFAGEIIESLPIEELRPLLTDLIFKHLQKEEI